MKMSVFIWKQPKIQHSHEQQRLPFLTRAIHSMSYYSIILIKDAEAASSFFNSSISSSFSFMLWFMFYPSASWSSISIRLIFIEFVIHFFVTLQSNMSFLSSYPSSSTCLTLQGFCVSARRCLAEPLNLRRYTLKAMQQLFLSNLASWYVLSKGSSCL